MVEEPIPLNKLPKIEVPINITQELKETFDSVKTALSDVSEFALKQPIPRKQLVLMTDTSFRIVGYAFMIEDNPEQKKTVKAENVRPRDVWFKEFLPRATQNVQILKGIFGNLYGNP